MDQTDQHSSRSATSLGKTKYLLIGILVFSLALYTILSLTSERRQSGLQALTISKNLTLNVKSPTSTNSTTTTTSSASTFPRTTTSTTTIIRLTNPPSTSQSTKLVTSSTQSTSTTIIFDEALCNNMSDSRQVNRTEHPCERIRCAVILRSSTGRLGNRMFMFASAYGLARAHHCRLHVTDSINRELLDNFQMKPIDDAMWLSQEVVQRLTNIRVKYNVCTFINSLMHPKAFENLELTGYWQSYLYFDAYRDEIRGMFSGRNSTLTRLATYFTSLTKADCPLCAPLPSGTQDELRQALQTRYNITWISVHIRRSDFRGIGYASDDAYVRQAMAHYRRRYHSQQIRFLVASDDKGYCKEFFVNEIKNRKAVILPDEFSQAEDLIALSLCQHSIVTGGTYSFWSAYLTGGDVIHDISYSSGCLQSDYYPPWFLLIKPLSEKKPSGRWGTRRHRWIRSEKEISYNPWGATGS